MRRGTLTGLVRLHRERMMSDALREISFTLREERGMGPGVAIWPSGEACGDHYHDCSVGEFLSDPINQHGTWCIDGGWGGPPGPIVVRWHKDGYWENGGYCGWRFRDDQ